MVSLTFRIWKEMIQMNLFIEQKHTHQLREETYGYQWGRMWGGGEGTPKVVWDDRYSLLYLKWKTNKDLL